MNDDLVERLEGKVRVPITDGIGPAGGEEPDNADFFVRSFPATPLALEAAARITELEDELSTWKSVFPDIAPERILPDRSLLEADNKALVEALKTIERASLLGTSLFEQRVKERKNRLTWWAVNYLQDCVASAAGHARQALTNRSSQDG